MFEIKLSHQNGYAWYDNGTVFVKGLLFVSDTLLKGPDLVDFFAECSNPEQFKKRLEKANGIFSVVVKKDTQLWVAVDRLRCFPIFYRSIDGVVRIGDDVDALFDAKESKVWNQEARRMFAASGYMVGEDTLVEGVNQVQAGEWVLFEGNGMKRDFYFRFSAPARPESYEQAKRELHMLLDRVGKRLVQALNGCPVAVPLSGGLDSRLIAHLLHENDCQNVICFTYGKKSDNDEWQRSKQVAEHYGYPWFFVDYENVDVTNLLSDEHFLSYCHYAAQYSSKFYFSEYFAARFLQEAGHMASNTVFVPGHSGDMIAGSHLRPYMRKYQSVNQIVDDLLYTHFNLVETTCADRRLFRKRLAQQLRQMRDDRETLYGLLECWDVRERQAKYIVNSCKLWEFMGNPYLLPLWDAELTDFFAALPFEYRICKKLYEDVLWEMFGREGVLYDEDKKMTLPSGKMADMKLWVKRHLPFLRPKTPLFAHDPLDFQRLTVPMRQALAQSQNQRHLRSYNAIMSEWYLMKVSLA